MKRFLHFPFFLLILSMTGCSGNYEYKEHKGDFPNKVWEEDHTLSFEPELDSSGTYRVLLDFRHVHGFGTPELRLQSVIRSPSGNTEKKDHKIRILKKGEQGQAPEYLSDCSGDICDRTEVLYEEKAFPESGQYEITLQQMNQRKLANVMEVGIMLERNMSGEDVVIQKDAVQGR